jgi:DNA-binding XRE family transcriptional regulator
MAKPRTFSPMTTEAARLLGTRIQVARRERRWTLQSLAERVGVSRETMHKVERGDLTISLGTAFEAAAVLGVALFDEDRSRRSLEAGRLADRLAVLPKQVRQPVRVDDDF